MPEPITTVSVRRLLVLGHTVTDGLNVWETAGPSPSTYLWGVIVQAPDAGTIAVAPTEEQAREGAKKLCDEQGWLLIDDSHPGVVN